MLLRKIRSKVVYKNPWFQVREDIIFWPDKKRSTYSFVERSNVNFIIAQDEQKSIFFVEEYRYPVKKSILQLPAGVTDKKEKDLSAAKRELLEETGLKANEWKKIGQFFIGPGHENIRANVFWAKNINVSQPGKSRNNKEREFIFNIRKIPIKKIKGLIKADKIECGITLAALNIFFTKIQI